MRRLKLLITGISGFIGRSLVVEIVRSSLPWDIFGIDIKTPDFNDSKYLKYIDFKVVDIRDKNAVDAYFCEKKFDGVIHLAAVSRVVDAENDKENCVAVNLYGTKNVVRSVAENPETWFVFGSSREVYGEQPVLPVKESAEKRPLNIYGKCKLLGETAVKKMIKKYVILRFSNVYGNNYDIDGRVIPTFVKRALNGETLFLEGGGQIIDFTYIDDTVNCIIRTVSMLQENNICREEMHVCPGFTNRITSVIGCLEKLLHKKIDVKIREKRGYDVVRFVGDPRHRIELLGKADFKTLDKGIECYLEGMKRNG
jgi:nucleoside-diphosphate-sugar epimerase